MSKPITAKTSEVGATTYCNKCKGKNCNCGPSSPVTKKDACYSKVKSRYKKWPSAYASGALVKCRKVGAANWGNKSK
jgi:hypothetical protein